MNKPVLDFSVFQKKVAQEFIDMGAKNMDYNDVGFSRLFTKYRDEYENHIYTYAGKTLHPGVQFTIPAKHDIFLDITLLGFSAHPTEETNGFLFTGAKGLIDNGGMKRMVKLSLNQFKTYSPRKTTIKFVASKEPGHLLLFPSIHVDEGASESVGWGAMIEKSSTSRSLELDCSISHERPDFTDAHILLEWSEGYVKREFF